ncbi:DMT family transporter [Novispirillum sp. DQ9]|uniref:DMT family transporter n=1 Tax=Novispirillum sp. DQ9 TaxID=3398612 RepID=UPI003C79E6C3
MPLRDYLLVFLVIATWGLNFVVIKIGVAEFPPFLMTALRFGIVAACVVPFMKVPWHAMRWLALLSFTLGTHFALLFAALKDMDGSTGAILAQLGVPFSTLLAAVFLGDRLGPWRTVGLALAFLGAAVLAGEPRLPGVAPFVLMVLSALGWAVSNLFIRRVADVHPLAVTGWISLLTLPQALLWSALFEDGQWQAMAQASWVGWAAVVYIAVVASMLAYSVWYHLLGKHPVNHVVPFTLLAPVLGAAASSLLLGEPLTWYKLLGGALTIAGVGTILIRQGHRAPVVPPQGDAAAGTPRP